MVGLIKFGCFGFVVLYFDVLGFLFIVVLLFCYGGYCDFVALGFVFLYRGFVGIGCCLLLLVVGWFNICVFCCVGYVVLFVCKWFRVLDWCLNLLFCFVWC